MSRSWLPVESNPEVFNTYAQKLGFPTDQLLWQDLLSTDDWAQDMIAQPCRAVAMLYTIVPAHEAHREAQEVTRAAAAAAAGAPTPPLFIEQDIPNACGTIALLHAVGSIADVCGGDVPLPADSWLRSFFTRAAPLTPAGRAALLNEDDTIDEEQAVAVADGQSEQVSETWQHFVCFTFFSGHLWELDGRKVGPIDHGPSSQATLLADAVVVLKAYMARDPQEVRFTMLALAPPPPEEEA